MSEPKLCCNCIHCARWKKSTGVECHCDLDDKYLGYLQVMDEENDCKNWEKETKWDLEREHDEKIREDAFKDTELFREIFLEELIQQSCDREEAIMYRNICAMVWSKFLEQLKEKKNDD